MMEGQPTRARRRPPSVAAPPELAPVAHAVAATEGEAGATERGEGRRRLLFGGALGASGFGAVVPSRAYELESNRLAKYLEKARQLNDATDWFLFVLRPLVYPKQRYYTPEVCAEMGESCPERSGLKVISDMYISPPQPRGTTVLSLLDRTLYTPLKLTATSAIFDPDTEDTLRDEAFAVEQASERIGKAARSGDLSQTRLYYDRGVKQLNKFYDRVNSEMGAPAGSEYFLTLLPADDNTLDEDLYWTRRKQRFAVKRKVDAMAKGNKQARFYAKSIFGDDAVSWDVRGDRASDFYGSEAPKPKAAE